ILINSGFTPSTNLSFKRMCASNTRVGSINQHVWLVNNTSNSLFEDICGFGWGRNILVQGGSTTNIYRRVWFRWEGYDNNGPLTPVQTSYADTGGSLMENVITIWSADIPGTADPAGGANATVIYRNAILGTPHRLMGLLAYGYSSPLIRPVVGWLFQRSGNTT